MALLRRSPLARSAMILLIVLGTFAVAWLLGGG